MKCSMVQTDPLDDITIVIPTYNRNYFLSRLLCYLKKNDFNNIIIADSSISEKYQVNRKTVKSLFGDSILHTWTPETGNTSHWYTKVLRAIEKIETPATTLCSDKDFPIIPGIRQCIEYLNKNLEYNVIDGKFYSFIADYSKKQISWRRTYTSKEVISEKSPILRIDHLLRNYNPLSYSIHRTPTICEVFSKVTDYTEDVRFGELFTGAYPLTIGKYMHLDIDYWCRESNTFHSGSRNHLRLDDYMLNGTYRQKYENFKEGLYSNLPVNSLNEANQAIDLAMEIYLRRSYPHSFGKNAKSIWINFLKSVFNNLSDSHKIKLKDYMNRIHFFPKGANISDNDLPLELREINDFLQKSLDNNAYTFDIPLCLRKPTSFDFSM